jgi:hypothetical protein
MGAIRYQTNGFSIDGIEYRISIFDKSYSGSIVSDFVLDSNFFELRYDSGADENYSPIIGSELTLNIELFKNAARNDTNLFTFLKNMISQNSQTYYIIIEENISGTWTNYWRGNVVQDQSTWNNDALEGGKTFKVTANDFAFLNQLPFELLSTAIPKVVAEYPLRSLMNAALTKLGIYDDFSGDILYYFLHNINWYETTIPLLDRANTDILYSILSSDSNFTVLNEDKTINTINYIEVLKTICIIFGCRLIQSNGKFWAIQMANYANPTVKFYQRGIDMNNPTNETISPRKAVDNSSGPLKILEGGSYAGIRPYFTVFVEKPSLDTLLIPTNQKDPFDINHLFATNKSILFTGGNNNKLKINLSTETLNKNPHSTVRDTIPGFSIGNFDLKVSKTDFIAQIIKVRIKTVAGVNWYLNDNGTNLFWSTTLTTGFVSFETYSFAIGYYNGKMDSTLISPAMPNFDFNEVYIEAFIQMEGYVDIGGIDYHTTSGVQTFFTGNMDCKFLENGTDENEKTTYRATISPKPFDPIEKQIEKVYLYDTEISKNKATMHVNYGSNPVTKNWISGLAIGSTYNILELVVLNALAQNRAVKEIITATIKGNYYPHQLLTYDSKQWHLKQATYNAGSNQWNGEWWELQYDETSISTTANLSTGDWQDTVLIG